jgi:hypothetical protein
MQDLLAGRVQMMCDFIPQSLPQIRAGALRALAVTGPARSPQLPEIPTMAEAGVPDFVTTAWLGLYAPSATLPALTQRLYREMVAIDADPGIPAAHQRCRGGDCGHGAGRLRPLPGERDQALARGGPRFRREGGLMARSPRSRRGEKTI